MVSEKEQSQAFMSSPNDALHSAMQSNQSNVAFRNPEFSRMSPHNQTNGHNLFSPSHRQTYPQTPSSARKLSISTSTRATPSANHPLLPPSATDGPEPSDEEFWYNLHLQALTNFELERATWKKMTERLRRDVENLKAELDEGRRANMQDSAFFSANRKDSDRSQYNEDVRNHAEQKLRQLNVVSPHTVASPDQIMSPAAIGPEKPSRRISSAMRLPSINEDDRTPSRKRVSITEPIVLDHIPSPGSPLTTSTHLEDPLSPPSTAYPQSPQPASYTLDAGHTPRRNSTSRTVKPHPLHTKRPNIRNNSVVPGFNADNAVNAVLDEAEDDRELDSPKMLPTRPSQDKGSKDMLDRLCGKLEEVAEHPEENEPEVLKHEHIVMEGEDGEAIPGKPSEDVAEAETQVEVLEELDKGIKLKSRRSLNFGAPLGMSR